MGCYRKLRPPWFPQWLGWPEPSSSLARRKPWGRQYAETGAYDKARAELSKLLQADPKNTKAPGQMDNLLLPGFLDNQNAIYCQVVECLFDAAGPADFQILDALILP